MAQINQNVNVTNYFYRADGVKVKKKFVLTNSAGTKIINTEHLDGFQYSTPNTEPIRKALDTKDDATMDVATAGEEEAFSKDEDKRIAIIDTGNPPVVDNMILSFFPTSEGFYDYENFRYIYQYKDHLGNVRVSYVKNGNDLQIMDRNDYYPFGMSFLKPFGQVSVYDPMAIPYNYKYNGKELQETGMYDYGARMYMPDIGRWGVVDPLAEKYLEWSPFNYTLNNPISNIDPDGRGVLTDFTLNKKTGEVRQVGETNNDPDRIVKSKDGEVVRDKKGNVKVEVDNIAKGILKDGQNLKTSDQIVDVGEKGQPTLAQAEEFAVKLSDYLGVELTGAYLSKDSGKDGAITKFYLDKYNKNTYNRSYGSLYKCKIGDPRLNGYFNPPPAGASVSLVRIDSQIII